MDDMVAPVGYNGEAPESPSRYVVFAGAPIPQEEASHVRTV